MTLSTLVRFTEPIDPRAVWSAAVKLIGAPGEYRYRLRRAGCEDFGGTPWPPNDQYAGEGGQGANALLWMSYGHEGSPLRDDPDDGPLPPAGYVELDFDTGYGYRDEDDRGCGDLHAGYIAALAAWSPVPIAWREEYTGEWFTGLSELHRLGVVRAGSVRA